MILPYALAYARKGWRVLPLHYPKAGGCSCRAGLECSSPGKHPMDSGWTASATTNPDEIRAIWTEHPQANIGIATGQASGVVVLDLDGPRGFASFAKICKKHGRPDPTIVCVTGSGGRHIYWRSAGPCANKVGLMPGVDIRGDGGLVVAPPSMHASGSRYIWHKEGTPGAVPLTAPPEWFTEALRGGRRTERTRGKYQGPRPKIKPEDIDTIPAGGRNRGLFEVLGRIAWENREGEPRDLQQMADLINRTKCQPPLSDREVRRIVQSVLTYG